MKPSEIFEGENSGLRKTFDEAVAREQSNIDKIIHQALAEDRKRVVDILDQEVMWYNTNNQIPDSELGKSEEHWDMLRKIVRDSLEEVAMSTRVNIASLGKPDKE